MPPSCLFYVLRLLLASVSSVFTLAFGKIMKEIITAMIQYEDQRYSYGWVFWISHLFSCLIVASFVFIFFCIAALSCVSLIIALVKRFRRTKNFESFNDDDDYIIVWKQKIYIYFTQILILNFSSKQSNSWKYIVAQFMIDSRFCEAVCLVFVFIFYYGWKFLFNFEGFDYYCDRFFWNIPSQETIIHL